jgi:AraC-like DNA-binding protein
MHERAISYEILMAKYRAEKEVGDKFTHHKTNQLSTTGLVEETLPSDAVLFDQLNAYFETNKPYLDQKLNLATIATGINASQKDINKVLKDNNIASFYAFVNEYRVNEARRLFSNPANNNLKLEVIAEMAGFGTRQTFYSAFLQYTGVTPGYYRKNI